MGLQQNTIQEVQSKMSLTDVLGGVAQGALYLAGASAIIYCGKELFNKHYIPFTKELETELDKHPELDGYKFPGDKKEDNPVKDVGYNRLYWNALTKPFKDMCKIGRK